MSERAEISPNCKYHPNRAYAIAYGACLIANGLVDPTEKYIHTLGIIVDTINSQANWSSV
ncbi:hypothetical protein [uncultured Nostoc sp.]|uniref:hypothetical protein n=1 Tax=uncultured Nostoc sp. TaxID=340711 RepID=UPI0035CBEBF5